MSENRWKKGKTASLDFQVMDQGKKRVDYEKEQENIYKNAFKIKKRPGSERARSNERTLKSQVTDTNSSAIELKQTIHRQQLEITRLKTQAQYNSKEMEKFINDKPQSDFSLLNKLILSQKKMIEDLKEQLNQKDLKIEEIKKNSKFFQVKELESENNILTDLCTKLNFEITRLANQVIEIENNKNQDEEIQKNILINQLKNEKEDLNQAINEKNEEIMKWRERVVELEKNEGKFKKNLKKKWKNKEKDLNKEINNLKVQLENIKKRNEENQIKYQEDLAAIQLEIVNERNSKRAKYSPDVVARVKYLDPVPGLLNLVQKKIEESGSTLDLLLHKLVITHTNNPTIADFQNFFSIENQHRYLIEELIASLSQNHTISIINFSEFFSKLKFMPAKIQKILRHLTKKLQICQIPRNYLKSRISTEYNLKSLESLYKLFESSPFELNSHDSSTFIHYFFPSKEILRSSTKSNILNTIICHFPLYLFPSKENESLYITLISDIVTSNLDSILNLCSEYDKTHSSMIPIPVLIKTLENNGLEVDKEIENFIEILAYKASKKLKKVNYLNFINNVSPEVNQTKITSYYFSLIKSKLVQRCQSLGEVFKVNKINEVSGSDFIEALEILGLGSIPPIHLSGLIESVQILEKQELCIDFQLLSNMITNS